MHPMNQCCSSSCKKCASRDALQLCSRYVMGQGYGYPENPPPTFSTLARPRRWPRERHRPEKRLAPLFGPNSTRLERSRVGRGHSINNTTMPRQELALSIPPGPLGVTIKRCGVEGRCIVTGVSGKVATDLEEGDVIQSLNGITLTEIEGAGVQVWVQLFKSMTTGERKVVVLRARDRNGAARDSATKLPAKMPAAGTALKDSTKHNASPPKRQKVDGAAGKGGKSVSAVKDGIEVISLLDDSDEEEEEPRKRSSNETDRRQKSGGLLAAAGKLAAVGKSGGSNDLIELLDSDTEEDADPDVMEVAASAAASQWKQAAAASSSLTNDSDEELAIVGTKGSNALVDFPHARTNCVTYPFSGDKAKKCANCYCYVCDIPASECKEWTYHCVATHEDRRWREERERAKRRAREPASAARAGTSAAATSTNRQRITFSLPAARASSRSNARTPVELSVRKLLEKVTTVHPVEISPPVGSGFTTSLRHYQKQSLAFMVDTERTSSRGGWLADEVGMGKSAVVLALVATSPPNANSLSTQRQREEVFATIDANISKRWEIQSAFSEEQDRLYSMQDDCERGTQGWKDIEERLKKNRHTKDARLSSEMLPKRKIKVKASVILTSASLLGQWEDECKKHAPGLRVKTFHCSRSTKATKFVLNRASIPSLNEIDVIISTSTFHWPKEITRCVEFHRVVHDESHLLGKGSSASISSANAIKSPRRWGVTATPATHSASELTRQLSFIQCDRNSSLRLAISSFQSQATEPHFNHLVDLLQAYMIRHTKSQRIGGSAALALPPSTTSTVMLTMSAEEDRALNCINGVSWDVTRHCTNGVKAAFAEQLFVHQMSRVDSQRLTKVAALRKDLAELKRREPCIRAVVFTQFTKVHSATRSGLQRDGFDVFEFSGSSSSNKRDKAIRSFQSTTSRRPAVFVITLRSGSVGITLTAASRVYLMEPCLDPAVEVQAAGRIHRLGQDKPCHVVKYAFRNSYESNVLRLHTEILAGRIAIVDGFVPPEAMRILAEGLPLRSG
ncbi:hypothetical protein ACHAXT_011822 [Thalassiosira profunda]